MSVGWSSYLETGGKVSRVSGIPSLQCLQAHTDRPDNSQASRVRESWPGLVSCQGQSPALRGRCAHKPRPKCVQKTASGSETFRIVKTVEYSLGRSSEPEASGTMFTYSSSACDFPCKQTPLEPIHRKAISGTQYGLLVLLKFELFKASQECLCR